MAIPYEKIVAEDLNIGIGTVAVTMPAGGTATGTKIGLQTLLGLGVYAATQFGPAGDGASIQAAINQAAADGGGIIWIAAGTWTLRAGLTVPVGITGPIRLQGAGRRRTILAYVGAGGTALTLGDSSADSLYYGVEGLTIDVSGASGTANGILATRGQVFAFRQLLVSSVVVGTMGTGISIQGTGGTTTDCDLETVQVTGNWTKGIWFQGPALNTCNNHMLRHVAVSRTIAQPGTGTIGIHFDVNCGDNYVGMPDVEGYDTGYLIDGRYTRGFVRLENCGVGVNMTANSFYNHVVISSFIPLTTPFVNGGGAFNSAIFAEDWQQYRDGTDLIFRQNNQLVNGAVGGNAYSDIRAGGSSDFIAALRLEDRTGTIKWQIQKTIGNVFLVLDPNNKTRLSMLGSANDATSVMSAGTAPVALNVNNTGAAGGTGGVVGGDGSAVSTWGVTGAGDASFAGLHLGASVGAVNLAAANATVVACTFVKFNSLIFLSPTNAQATTLMRGASAPYVLTRTAGVGFTIQTADGGAAAGTETFYWVVINP